MEKVTPISSRKADHIRINLEEDVRSGLSTGLERYRFIHQALPELDLEEVNTGVELFGRRLQAPVLISSMTGGTPEAAQINQILAAAAQEAGVAMGLGSQRAALEDPQQVYSFQVRQSAPDILLFANLGAVQLNYAYTAEHCQRAIDMISADALVLHLNPLQEALQPEGDTRFSSLLKKIEAVCRVLPVPVIAKEVGWGISEQTARRLSSAGVAAIDVAGAGGTSWSQVEMHRAQNEYQARLAASFINWGIPTSESILNVKRTVPDVLVFASGGLKDGIDIAKCIALGAVLGGLASPFLKAAARSLEDTVETIQLIKSQIRVSMFAAGVKNLDLLNRTLLQEI